MVSIIIPVYNAQPTISKCLESILKNSYENFEIVAINDGSADGSWEILESYRKKYPEKIRIYNQDNLGVAQTRNRGMEYSRFEYIMFVDNDDWIDQDYIERFVKEIAGKKLDMVIGGYRRTTEDKILFEMRLKDVLWSRYMIMAPWAKIYRRDFLSKHKIEFLNNNIGEDVYFNLQALNLTKKISVLEYCGYNWFFNSRSISNARQNQIQKRSNVLFLLDSSYEKLKEMGANQKKDVEYYFVRYVVWYLLYAGRRSSYPELLTEFQRNFAWLKEKYPAFSRNCNIGLFRPAGETPRNRIAVFAFLFLHRIGLSRLFLRIYAGKR